MIPIGDSPTTRRRPWVTYILIALNLLAFAFTITRSTDLPGTVGEFRREMADQTGHECYGFEARPTEIDRFFCTWSFQPREFFDVVQGTEALPGVNRVQVILTIITSIFIHGGWLHIAGNMLFLWVFGDNVEDRLGKIGYLLFYLLGGVVASLAQGWVDPNSLVPTVGASGAVAAVLGAYLIYYPRATVTTLVPIFFFIPLPIPAVVMIGLWFVQNLLSGVATLGTVGTPDSSVAFFAHVGGFLFGAVAVFFFFRHVGESRAPARR